MFKVSSGDGRPENYNVTVPSLLNLNKFNSLVKCYHCYFGYDYLDGAFTAQKMKFSINDSFSKCDQITFWSHLLNEYLMETFIFCAVEVLLRLTFFLTRPVILPNLYCMTLRICKTKFGRNSFQVKVLHQL